MGKRRQELVLHPAVALGFRARRALAFEQPLAFLRRQLGLGDVRHHAAEPLRFPAAALVGLPGGVDPAQLPGGTENAIFQVVTAVALDRPVERCAHPVPVPGMHQRGNAPRDRVVGRPPEEPRAQTMR